MVPALDKSGLSAIFKLLQCYNVGCLNRCVIGLVSTF